MKVMRFKSIIFMALPLMLGACASVDAAKGTQGSGVTKTYNAGFDTVWMVSEDAVQSTGGKIVEDNKAEGSIVASYGVSAFSWGERVGIFVKPVSDIMTEVEVVSQRAVGVNVTATNWEPKIHNQIEEKLNNR